MKAKPKVKRVWAMDRAAWMLTTPSGRLVMRDDYGRGFEMPAGVAAERARLTEVATRNGFNIKQIRVRVIIDMPTKRAK